MALIRAGASGEAAWQGGPGPGCWAGACVGNLGSTGSAFLLIMTSRYRDGWQWPACAGDGDVLMACPHNPFPPHTQQVAQLLTLTIDRHTLVSSRPSIAVPVLSWGDKVSWMLSSQGTAVRYRLAGSLSPMFSGQSGVASDSISSEDRLRPGCGPLQMPAKNREMPMRVEMGDSCQLPSHTQPQVAGEASQHSNFMPAIIPHRTHQN